VQAAEVINRGGPDANENRAADVGSLHTHTLTSTPACRQRSPLAHLMEHLAARETNEFTTGIPELDDRHVVRRAAPL